MEAEWRLMTKWRTSRNVGWQRHATNFGQHAHAHGHGTASTRRQFNHTKLYANTALLASHHLLLLYSPSPIRFDILA